MPEIFSLVYAFASKTKAGHAYDAVRNLIFLHPCDLGCYRAKVNGTTWMVFVVGDRPSLVVSEPIVKALKKFGGMEVKAPEETILLLYLRHVGQSGQEWSEQSYE